MNFHKAFFLRSSRLIHTVPRQTGVASIEYALIVSLIAVAILGALQATGSANGGIWENWTGKFVAAVNSVIGP